jgi:hypothetical protein
LAANGDKKVVVLDVFAFLDVVSTSVEADTAVAKITNIKYDADFE